MTPEQWRRVGELFHEALDVDAAERTAWAHQATATDTEVRGELLSLLESDRAAADFVNVHVKSAVVSMFTPAASVAQRRVGPYKLVRELGRGGMGTVFLAERDDEQYRSQVAIKLVRPGMDTDFILRRFRRERQILAELQHPHIARLLDGGTTDDGQPYIVMEYVDGVAVTEYVKAHVPSIPDRLRLFLDVCGAVAYAHHHFVVHRDIKPGNILISTAGSVKLLDFGICKLLHNQPQSQDTATVQMLTPDYASPEQVRGDPVTIASDIYSLAAVLYELLTGHKPHRIEKLTPQGIEKAICEQDVIRPSEAAGKALGRRLEGDLDNILLHALQKDPERRYASVEQFADDIHRHLTHEPVSARPDTIGYRVRKFVLRRRNPLLAATVAAACLIAGLIVSLREAAIANANFMEARKLANAFVFGVHDAVRDLPGSTRARQMIVETGLRYLDGVARNSRGDWALTTEVAGAYQRIGDVQGDVMGANLGNTKAALESYRKAMSLVDAALEHSPQDRTALLVRMTVLQRIGTLYVYTQESRQALASLREAQRIGEELLSRNPKDPEVTVALAQSYSAAGDALSVSGALAASIDQHSKAVGLLQKCGGSSSLDGALKKTLAAAYSAIGINEARLGHLDKGLEHYRRALPLMQELTKQYPANVSYQRALMSIYSHLGDVLGNPKWRSLRDPEGALKAYRQTLAAAQRLYDADPANQQAASDLAIALTRVAALLPARDGAQRLSMLKESLRLLAEIQEVNPQNTMNRWDLSHGYMLLGDALIATDRPAAVRAYEQSVGIGEALLEAGVDSPAPDLVTAHEKLALIAAEAGQRDAALTHARRSLEISDPAKYLKRGRAENVQRFLTPRGSSAMGLAYAALARAKTADPQVADDDQRHAREWLQKSLAAWHDLKADPAFGPSQASEMRLVEAAAAQVRLR